MESDEWSSSTQINKRKESCRENKKKSTGPLWGPLHPWPLASMGERWSKLLRPGLRWTKSLKFNRIHRTEGHDGTVLMCAEVPVRGHRCLRSRKSATSSHEGGRPVWAQGERWPADAGGTREDRRDPPAASWYHRRGGRNSDGHQNYTHDGRPIQEMRKIWFANKRQKASDSEN